MRWCSPKLHTKIELGVCQDNLLSWMCHSLIWHLLLVVSLCPKDIVLILWWCGLKASIQRSSTLSSNDFVPNILSGRCACIWITWIFIALRQLHSYYRIKGYDSSSIHHTLLLAIQLKNVFQPVKQHIRKPVCNKLWMDLIWVLKIWLKIVLNVLIKI